MPFKYPIDCLNRLENLQNPLPRTLYQDFKLVFYLLCNIVLLLLLFYFYWLKLSFALLLVFRKFIVLWKILMYSLSSILWLFLNIEIFLFYFLSIFFIYIFAILSMSLLYYNMFLIFYNTFVHQLCYFVLVCFALCFTGTAVYVFSY